DQALTTGAAQLADLGNTETLNIRRSLALGEMSRTQYALPLHTPSTASGSPAPDAPPAPVQRRARVLNLFLHLHPDGTALLENTNTLLTLEQVKTWCTDPDTTLTLRPVIDLAQQITTPTYAPSDRLREQVIQRDQTCVFPHCTTPARACDLDHITPYDPHGPCDQTTTWNLACLCRTHHRLKTFHHWTYTQTHPGIFEWRSPHGYHYRRDHHGTHDTTPQPPDPPPSARPGEPPGD
ncbi:MAG: HNH endonuclease signature motif containing protein, partial [Marmoricola sp.]